MILVCESCGENRRHHERIIGDIGTLEEHTQLVCSECGNVSHRAQSKLEPKESEENNEKRRANPGGA